MAELSGDWTLRYTTHLGFSPPEKRPQFLATLGTADPAAHIRHAAELGVAGVLYPWAMERPPQEHATARRALEETGLSVSCLVVLSPDGSGPPVWTDRSPAGRARLESAVLAAARLGGPLRVAMLVALVETDPDRDDAPGQRADAAANLHDMARIADAHGMGIGVEPMVVRPRSMLRTTASACDFLAMADHPRAGLVYDTVHSAMMDGDIVAALADAFDRIALVQIADHPGRVEPGAGELPLVEVAAEAVRRGYTGLVDLEHNWRDATADGERAGLTRLREFDGQVRKATA